MCVPLIWVGKKWVAGLLGLLGGGGFSFTPTPGMLLLGFPSLTGVGRVGPGEGATSTFA